MNVGDARRAWDLLETVASDVAPAERRISAIDQLTDLLVRVREKEVALAARQAEAAAREERAARARVAAREQEAAKAARDEEEFARRFGAGAWVEEDADRTRRAASDWFG